MSMSNTLTPRRKFLMVGATAMAGGALGSCSSLSGAPSLTAAAIDAIQAAVAVGCSWVPAAQSLITIVGDFPALNGASTITSALLTEVSNFLCAAFTAGGGVNAAVENKGDKMTMKLKDGVTAVPVHGLVFINGHFVQF